jgi:hypothetical protein
MHFKIDQRDSRTVARLKMLYLVPLLLPIAAANAVIEFAAANISEIWMIWNHKPTREEVMPDETDTAFQCTVCCRIGSVGRCCGEDTRTPLNESAKVELAREQKKKEEE